MMLNTKMEIYQNVYNPSVSYLRLDSFVVHDRSYGPSVDVYLTAVVVLKEDFTYLAVIPTDLLTQNWVLPTGVYAEKCLDHIAYVLSDFLKANPFVTEGVKDHYTHLGASYVARYKASISYVERFIRDEMSALQALCNNPLQIIIYLKNVYKRFKKCNFDLPMLNNELSWALVEEANRRMLSTKAKIIQKYWKECITNPNHVFCKRRLAREFDDLMIN
jgi:hypothetical protein